MENFLDERNATYDTLAKRFLAHKSILAHVLKHTVAEFADCSLADIEQKYIEGDPTATINTVPLDDTLDIKGKHTESNSPIEGLITFDIIFDAFAPSSGEPIKLIINIEPQKTTTSIDYKLMKRAVYYVVRLISSQKEKKFKAFLDYVDSSVVSSNFVKELDDAVQLVKSLYGIRLSKSAIIDFAYEPLGYICD